MSPRTTKEQLINHALLFFASNDYERSSLNDISAALGVTKGAIYHYFTGKDELFELAVRKLLEMIGNWLRGSIDSEMNFEGYLKNLFRIDVMIEELSAEAGLANTLADYENVMYMVFAGIKKFPNLKVYLRTTYDSFQKDLVRLMRRASAASEIQESADFEAIAYEITAFYEGALLLGAMSEQKDYVTLGPRVCSEIWKRLKIQKEGEKG